MSEIPADHALTRRARIAYWTPAFLIALWCLLIFDFPWYQRLLYAALFGMFAQVFLALGYFVTVYFAARLLGQEPIASKVDFYDYRLFGAILFAACLWIWLQHARSESERHLMNCISNETEYSPFGQFDNARDLLSHCIEEAGASASDVDEW